MAKQLESLMLFNVRVVAVDVFVGNMVFDECAHANAIECDESKGRPLQLLRRNIPALILLALFNRPLDVLP